MLPPLSLPGTAAHRLDHGDDIPELEGPGLKGEHKLDLSIWTDEEGGDNLWQETHWVDTKDTDGNYSVILGKETPLTWGDGGIFNGESRYLEIEVFSIQLIPPTTCLCVGNVTELTLRYGGIDPAHIEVVQKNNIFDVNIYLFSVSINICSGMHKFL